MTSRGPIRQFFRGAVNKGFEASCEFGSVKVNYLRCGAGRTSIVLLHGLLANGACWTPVSRCLQEEFDIVMPDSRGHGRSSAPFHGYRYDDLARDVESLVSHLGLVDPVLMGHSMGGMTAAVVAARNVVPIRGLVLVDPAFLTLARQREVRDSEIDDQHRIALMMSKSELVGIARERHPGRSVEVIELQAKARLQTRLAAFDVLTPPLPAYEEIAGSIKVPSMLVTGDREPIVGAEVSRRLQALIPHPRVARIEGAGHGIPHDQPELLARTVLPFVRELSRLH